MDKLLLGRYIPLESFVHNLDPRTKLLTCIFMIVVVFFANNWQTYLLLSLFIILAVYLSKLPLKFFVNGLKPMVNLILFTVLIQLLFSTGGEVYFKWRIFSITQQGLINAAKIFLRLVLIINISTILSLTTAPLEIADGLESLMKPLAKLGVPTEEIALMLSIALRYVPTLLDEAQTIMDAQRSRGVDFDEGSLLDRIKAIIPILIPLFISAFNRAEEMALAMEARGYKGTEGRTKYRKLSFSNKDALTLLGVILIIVATIYLRA